MIMEKMIVNKDEQHPDEPGKDESGKGLDSSVRRERRRRQRGERGRRISIGRYLATVGSIGWLVVTPTILGAFVGRWLDEKYQTGITFSGALMFLGLILGCYLAWTVLYTEGNKQ